MPLTRIGGSRLILQLMLAIDCALKLARDRLGVCGSIAIHYNRFAISYDNN